MLPSPRKLVTAAAFSVAVIVAPHTGSATVWNIDEIRTGSNGFGASSFHDATGNVMSGDILGVIANSTVQGWFGTFDDEMGVLAAVNLPVDVNGQTFTLDGAGFFFGAGSLNNPDFGTLGANNTLGLQFSGSGLEDPSNSALSIAYTVLGFQLGDVCCNGGAIDPNSFVSDGMGGAIMTLWGADGFTVSSGKYYGSKIGMDLRIHLTPVPLPAALPLFGGALGIMGLLGWRRRSSKPQTGA